MKIDITAIKAMLEAATNGPWLQAVPGVVIDTGEELPDICETFGDTARSSRDWRTAMTKGTDDDQR
jgi:hypothetical protein